MSIGDWLDRGGEGEESTKMIHRFLVFKPGKWYL